MDSTDKRIQRIIREHKELIRASKIIISVLTDSDSHMGHTELQSKTSNKWYHQEVRMGREGEEARPLTCFNRSIGALVDKKRIKRQALGKGMKYSLIEEQDN